MPNFFRFFAAFIALWSVQSQAQVPQNVTAKGFSAPYREGTQLKAFFSGDEAKPITGGKGELLVKNFEMKWFGKTTNDVEMIGKAPECFFNINDKTAWGTNRIEVFSGTTNFFIEGFGFRCQQTKSNAILIISNEVHTVLLRDDKTKTNSTAEVPLHILSEHFHFLSETQPDKTEKRIATYTKNVRVEDPEILLTSGLLTVDLPSGTNRVRNIVAERDVTIVSKRDNTRATGNRATYKRQEEEIITLYGNPGWKDAQSEGKADVLVFNKTRKTVRAESKAAVKFPRGTFADAGLFSGQTNVVADTNQFVEVTSELLVIGLPTTNRTSRSLVATTNVVIVSAADQSRATGDHVEFFEEQGLLRLTGSAEWKTDKIHAKGDSIWLNRSNRIFGARSRGIKPAYLRLLDNATGKAKPGTNEFIEITCNNYEVNTNVALFQSGSGEHLGISRVKTKFFEGGIPSFLTSQKLDVYFTNQQVSLVEALGTIVLEQQPDTTGKTNYTQKGLTCQKLTLERSPETGLTRRIVAEDNVKFAQIEHDKGKVSTNNLSASILTLTFSDKTNQVTGFVAEKDVRMEQGGQLVTGQHVVYNLTNDLVEVTGTPLLRTDKVIWEGAEILRFKPESGEVWSRPFVVRPIDPKLSPKELLK